MPPTVPLASASLFIIFRPCRYFTALQLPLLICNLTRFLLLAHPLNYSLSHPLAHFSGKGPPFPGNLWNGWLGIWPCLSIYLFPFLWKQGRFTACDPGWTRPDFPGTSVEWSGWPHLNWADWRGSVVGDMRFVKGVRRSGNLFTSSSGNNTASFYIFVCADDSMFLFIIHWLGRIVVLLLTNGAFMCTILYWFNLHYNQNYYTSVLLF